VENFSFNLILLDSDSMYVYVSMVVDNFRAADDEPMRHLPVYLSGNMNKDLLKPWDPRRETSLGAMGMMPGKLHFATLTRYGMLFIKRYATSI
jgi:hypothetical protein